VDVLYHVRVKQHEKYSSSFNYNRVTLNRTG